MWGKIVPWVLCVAIVLATVVAPPLTASAEPVRRDIASDPAKVIAEIEAMNLPDMPDEVAAQLRGEGWFDFLVGIAKIQGIKWITNSVLNSLAEKYGWTVRFGWFKAIDAMSY